MVLATASGRISCGSSGVLGGRVHFMRNALACVGKKDRLITAAAIQTALDKDSPEASKKQWAELAEAFEARHPKLAELMRRAEDEVLAYKSFPEEHWPKMHSTNPLERLNKEIKRRTSVVGIFPNEASAVRLVGALMLEQNDEWAIARRRSALETVAAIGDGAPVDPAMIAALQQPVEPRPRNEAASLPGTLSLARYMSHPGR